MLRLFPAYCVQIHELFGRAYLVLDYTCQVLSVLRLNEACRHVPVEDVVGRGCVAQADAWRPGRVVSSDHEWATVHFFDNEEERRVQVSRVIPNLSLAQIEAVLQARRISFDLHGAIKKNSLASETGAARKRAEKIQATAEQLADEIFPVVFGEFEARMARAAVALSEFERRSEATFHVERLSEPAVEFRDHHKLPDVREGITKYGSYDSDQHRIELVPVCLTNQRQEMESLIDRLKAGKFKYRGAERTFATRFADPEPLRRMLRACESTGEKAVRRIWLVGESLPLTKASGDKLASKTSQLDVRLVCLDPRHGVFPNLVMKPLFAATFAAFKENEPDAMALLRALEVVVCDKPDRRFNLFQPKVTAKKNPQSNRFVFDSLDQRIQAFDLKRDLWLVFGHQTVSGLLKWLLEGGSETTRDDLKRFLNNMVKTVIATVRPRGGAPGFTVENPGSSTGRVGFVHRLCTEHDPSGSGAAGVLRSVIEKMNTSRRLSDEFVFSVLRCTVPLMHNEAYQVGPHPTGNSQAHFVRCATKTTSNGDLYWQVMGHAIARRCFNRWVGQADS